MRWGTHNSLTKRPETLVDSRTETVLVNPKTETVTTLIIIQVDNSKLIQ